MGFEKPNKLRKGDLIAVLSPSAGVPNIFPHVFEHGIENLKKLGFNIKEFNSTREEPEKLQQNPKLRAEDINQAFKDKEVKGIIASIGGDDSVRILPYLDMEIIKRNPKFLMGFSDTTTLTTYLNQNGIVTFNGPTIMAGFSTMEAFGEEYFNHVKNFLWNDKTEFHYEPFSVYSEWYKDWAEPSNVGKLNDINTNEKGWEWVQGKDKVKGKLIGGCIEILEVMKSTEFWPSNEFWDDKILFLETSEEKPRPPHVKLMLRNYGMQGILDRISALLIGKPVDYSEEEKSELKDEVIDVVKNEFGKEELPIIMNMDFGHADPQFILPLGVEAEIDCFKKTFRLTEKPFKD